MIEKSFYLFALSSPCSYSVSSSEIIYSNYFSLHLHIPCCSGCIYLPDQNPTVPNHFTIWLYNFYGSNYAPYPTSVDFYLSMDILILSLNFVKVIWHSFRSLYSSLNTLWYPQLPPSGDVNISPHYCIWLPKPVLVCEFILCTFTLLPFTFDIAWDLPICMKPPCLVLSLC